MIDETGDPDRVIDHGHCSSIVEHSRLSSTILEYKSIFRRFNNIYLTIKSKGRHPSGLTSPQRRYSGVDESLLHFVAHGGTSDKTRLAWHIQSGPSLRAELRHKMSKTFTPPPRVQSRGTPAQPAYPTVHLESTTRATCKTTT